MLSGFCPASFGVLFCSLVLGCRYTLKLLDRAVSGPRFLAGGVSECDISHRRSVAVLCMLYKIRCNQVALSKLLKREGRAGAEGAILPYVGYLQLISTLKIGADGHSLKDYDLVSYANIS